MNPYRPQSVECTNCGVVNAPLVRSCQRCQALLPVEVRRGRASPSVAVRGLAGVVGAVGAIGALAYLTASDRSRLDAPVESADPSASRRLACESGVAEDCRAQCDGGHAASCRSLGKMYETGSGVPKNGAESARHLQRACDLGDMLGCSHLGAKFEEGRGVEKDVERAAQLLRQACDGGERRACRERASEPVAEVPEEAPQRPAPAPGASESVVVDGVGETERLPKKLVERIIRQNYGRLRACYERGLAKNPRLEGGIKVRFVIGRDGSVSNVTDDGSDIPDASVVSCVLRAQRAVKFPKPEGGIVTVAYPIRFSPG